jgi:hypothetical protein
LTDPLQDAVLVPSSNWGGPGLIGVTIRFSTVKGANELVWHVLVRYVFAALCSELNSHCWLAQDVYPDSPAQAAGLQPYADYVVGNAEQIFTSADDFLNLVQVCAANRPLWS